jgi:hypothetical protein
MDQEITIEIVCQTLAAKSRRCSAAVGQSALDGNANEHENAFVAAFRILPATGRLPNPALVMPPGGGE